MLRVVGNFSDINISQGSVATRLKCCGISYYRFAIEIYSKSVGERISKPVSAFCS